MIAYKVVEKGTRHCSNWTLYKWGGKFDKRLRSRLSPEQRQYFPRYLKGTTVTAAPRSEGILCFQSREDAQSFAETYRQLYNHGLIIKVRGNGRAKGGFSIALRGGCANPTNLLCPKERACLMHPPRGTVSFESVTVLE